MVSGKYPAVRVGEANMGNGHGTGLSSYSKTISREPGCVTRIYLRDEYFV